MCEGTSACQKPKELIGKPQGCSPEQVRKCHGLVKEHPCSDHESQESKELKGKH